MKKYYNLMLAAMVALVMSGVFTSCVDDDVEQAMALSG